MKKIKYKYNSEEHLGNLIFKLNKIKINRIRLIFRFNFKPSSETNYKNHYNCAIYTKIRTKPVLWTLLSLCLTLVSIEDFINKDSKKQRLQKRGFIVKIDVLFKTAFLKWLSVSMLVFLL